MTHLTRFPSISPIQHIIQSGLKNFFFDLWGLKNFFFLKMGKCIYKIENIYIKQGKMYIQNRKMYIQNRKMYIQNGKYAIIWELTYKK